MKIHLTKKGMTRHCQPEQLEQFTQAGWKPVQQEQAGEEVIRLKPPVKSKATVTALEAANIINKGDE